MKNAQNALDPEQYDDLLPWLQMLPNVKSIRLAYVEWVRIGKHSAAMTTSAFSNITSLDIYLLVFTTYKQFIELVCAFRHLEYLTLDPYIGEGDPPILPDCTLPPCLRSLTWRKDMGMRHNFLEWLILQKPLPPIETLELRSISSHETSSVGRLLTLLSLTLRQLFISLRHNITPSTLVQYIDVTLVRSLTIYTAQLLDHLPLHVCAELRIFHTAVGLQRFPLAAPNDAIFQLLSQVSHSVKIIRITLLVRSMTQLTQVDWNRLDNTLQHENRVGLERVELLPPCHQSDPAAFAFETSLVGSLPKCHTRGVLRILFSESGDTY